MRRIAFFWLVVLAPLLLRGVEEPSPASNPPACLQPIPPTLSPIGASPVDYVRQLLLRPPAERRDILAARSEKSRQFLEGLLAEFQALHADDRAARLLTLELRWYLLPLMKLPAGDRAARLVDVPERIRPMVRQRLDLWSLLPSPLPQEVLENELVLRQFITMGWSGFTRDLSSTNRPTARPAEVERAMARWNALPLPTRQRVTDNFQRFFELTPREKSKILGAMSEEDRRQIEGTLQSFERLSEADRERCLRGFKKFVPLSATQREAFLRNAELWQAMTPTERQLWREVVKHASRPRPPIPTSPVPGPK